MLRVLRPDASALVFVWAFEENASVRRHQLTILDGNEQDVLVPWNLQSKDPNSTESGSFNRYYHLFKKGELEGLVEAAGGRIVKSGYDRDNWFVVFRK